MQTIDMHKELQAIRNQFNPKYHLKPEATQAAADLWGGEPNARGVLPHKDEIIVQVGQCKGEIRFSETSKGYWLIGLSATSSYSGFGYAPSVWAATGYASYHDARLAGVLRLTDFFEHVSVDTSSTNSNTNRAHARKAVQLLNSEKTPQLDLFS